MINFWPLTGVPDGVCNSAAAAKAVMQNVEQVLPVGVGVALLSILATLATMALSAAAIRAATLAADPFGFAPSSVSIASISSEIELISSAKQTLFLSAS